MLQKGAYNVIGDFHGVTAVEDTNILSQCCIFAALDLHEKYMRRCLDLAQLGLGAAAPNPMVGAVIVHEGRIIGEGYHRQCGGPHAEVNAVNSVKDKHLLLESTIYVSLEPCAHFGKTPPCADLIVKHKIPRVVIACIDPFAAVKGKGIEKLKQGGCEVITGVLEKEALALNKRFITFHEQKRPYIFLKWAQTLDGFMDKKRIEGEQGIRWITGPKAKKMVHQMRSQEQAILIGKNTAINDNPSLTTRLIEGPNPLRLVLDRAGDLPTALTVLSDANPTLIFSADKRDLPPQKEVVKIDFSKSVINQILDELHQRDIQSVIVEGGQKLLASFIEAELWDEAFVWVGQQSFGEGLKAPNLPFTPQTVRSVDQDQLLHYSRV